MHQRCHQLMRESRPDGNSFLADKNEQYDGTTTGNRMRGFSSYLLYLAAKIPRFEEWFYLDGSACHVESVRKCAQWQSALYLLQSMEDTFSCIVCTDTCFASPGPTTDQLRIWMYLDFNGSSTSFPLVWSVKVVCRRHQ